MGLIAALIGGVSGTGMHMMTNSMRKVPLSRTPWMHVGYFVLGAWAGNKYVEVEKKMLMDVNEIRADKGLPPLMDGWMDGWMDDCRFIMKLLLCHACLCAMVGK